MYILFTKRLLHTKAHSIQVHTVTFGSRDILYWPQSSMLALETLRSALNLDFYNTSMAVHRCSVQILNQTVVTSL